MTISLPSELARDVDRARKTERRTRSDVVREALRLYFNPELAARIASLPVYTPTKREMREIEKARRSRSYLTIDELFRNLAGSRRGPRQKSPRPGT